MDPKRPISLQRSRNRNSSSETDSPQKRKIKKTKEAPSTESGGVPNPTIDYLDRARGSPATLPGRKPMLVILDLNGTLLRRLDTGAGYAERKHAKTFVSYCVQRFEVMIWSSRYAG